ncbi:hypothetical protein FF38_01437 [Lucilia cuprina]|uniref:Uncharacterized protein n=1 Tax=Lucilia cuprina TaxID=7375 RepID=A0A0L0CAD4_LUCCU|nr:hypothetical protein FF38_01437 [Lucilia cuprina]
MLRVNGKCGQCSCWWRTFVSSNINPKPTTPLNEMFLKIDKNNLQQTKEFLMMLKQIEELQNI